MPLESDRIEQNGDLGRVAVFILPRSSLETRSISAALTIVSMHLVPIMGS